MFYFFGNFMYNISQPEDEDLLVGCPVSAVTGVSEKQIQAQRQRMRSLNAE